MRGKVSIAFVMPIFILYTFMKIVPMIQSLIYSFTNYDGLRETYDFIGIDNYVRLLNDDRFLNSIKVTLIYVFIVVFFVNFIGLFAAIMLNNASKSNNLLRAIFFLPVIISQVAVAFMWKGIYSYNGILNFIIDSLNLSMLKAKWITDPSIALYSVSLVDVWRILGFHMMIILAALQTIPNDLYEAASIDGAKSFAKFRYITLPLVMPGLSVSILMATIGTMKQYDLVKIMTNGGPVASTEVISYTIMDTAFNFSMQGYATAMGMALLMMILIVTIIQNKLLGKKEVGY